MDKISAEMEATESEARYTLSGALLATLAGTVTSVVLAAGMV